MKEKITIECKSNYDKELFMLPLRPIVRTLQEIFSIQKSSLKIVLYANIYSSSHLLIFLIFYYDVMNIFKSLVFLFSWAQIVFTVPSIKFCFILSKEKK